MEPANAITGLLKSAGEVSRILGPYIVAFEKQLIRIAAEVHSEVQNTKLFLAALQGLIQNPSLVPVQHAALIKVDHLVAILTDGIIIFSQLEAAASSIRPFDHDAHSPGSSPLVAPYLLQDLQWNRNQPIFESILPRLEAFKTSLSLVVDILQADTHEHATQHLRDLDKRVDIILHDNPSLTSFLASNDEHKDQERAQNDRPPTEAGPSRQPQPPFGALQSTLRSLLARRLNNRSTSSATTTDPGPSSSPSSSPFASLALSEISSPSVITIPLQPSDITNPKHYRFNKTTSSSSAPSSGPKRTEAGFTNIPHSQPDKYIYHDCLLVKAQLEQVPRLKRFLDYPWPPPDDGISHSRVLTEMHLLRQLLRSGGLYVVGQMIQKVNQMARQNDAEEGGDSRVDGYDEEFYTWLQNPQPLYLRGRWDEPDSYPALENEVSYFTMACLEYRDLASVMKVKGSTGWLFVTKDLAQDEYKGFVKVC